MMPMRPDPPARPLFTRWADLRDHRRAIRPDIALGGALVGGLFAVLYL